MKLIAFLLALLLFLAIGFMVGFTLAALAHTNIMRGIAEGNAFTVGDKKYRAIEVDR
jgi:hypothetical protein